MATGARRQAPDFREMFTHAFSLRLVQGYSGPFILGHLLASWRVRGGWCELMQAVYS